MHGGGVGWGGRGVYYCDFLVQGGPWAPCMPSFPLLNACVSIIFFKKKVKQLLNRSQIIRYSGFSKYVAFAMHIDI